MTESTGGSASALSSRVPNTSDKMAERLQSRTSLTGAVEAAETECSSLTELMREFMGFSAGRLAAWNLSIQFEMGQYPEPRA